MIDLHMHTLYSDGTSDIKEIFSLAKELDLKQFAITDHNTLKGSLLAKEKADNNFIVGIELSVDYHGNELHLLGYFPDESATGYKNTQNIINESEAFKRLALMEMIENLNEMGYEISINELREFAGGVINRVHICRVLMKHGYIKSVDEGFKTLIGDHCPAYVERKKVTLEEGAQAIHKDGGITVIAHPYEYEKVGDINDFLENIMDSIDGIECLHPSADEKQTENLMNMAKKHQKKITGGSDFHGINKPDIKMGMMNVGDQYKIKRTD